MDQNITYKIWNYKKKKLSIKTDLLSGVESLFRLKSQDRRDHINIKIFYVK